MYTALASADIDGNGFNDIIISGADTSQSSQSVFIIYYNLGNGSFERYAASGIQGANFGSVNIADFNNDGRPDILVNGQISSTYITQIYSQGTNGSFTLKSENLMGSYFSETAVFDANADGLPDVLVIGFSTSYVPETKLYLDNGNFQFTEQESGLGGVYFSSIDIADINGDGFPDVLLGGMNTSYAGSVILYYNDGQGHFESADISFVGSYSGAVRFVDYDLDGDLDLFVIGLAGDQNAASFYKNDGQGNFSHDATNSALIPGLNMSRAEFADYNQDGKPDLLVIGYRDNLGVAAIFTNITEVAQPLDYCEVSVDYDVEPITRVSFAGIENKSSAQINGTPAYEDFTAISGTVKIGQTYTIAVEGNTARLFEHDIRVFIDWNQDGEFDMGIEYYWANLASSTGTDGVKAVADITVPENAVLGQTRIRIIKDMWNVYEPGEFDACLNPYYGQVEDYSLTVEADLSIGDRAFADVSIYPNPTTGKLFISSPADVASVEIVDLQGRSVGNPDASDIDLTQLPTGIYLAKISTTSGKTIIKRIIKE